MKITIKKATEPKKITPLSIAKDKVEKVKDAQEEYHQALEEFREEFPEANAKMQSIDEIRTKYSTAVEEAKAAVKDAGVTVGDFQFMAKKRGPFFDGVKALEILATMNDKDVVSTLAYLHLRGVLTGLEINFEAAKVVKNEDTIGAKLLLESYDAGGQALPPAVKTPKL